MEAVNHPVTSRRRLPSLNALRMFEAVARRASFTQAADELGVTQAAVSRQIKRLEEELSAVLFVRHHRAIALTAEGDKLYEVVRRSLDEIDGATEEIQRVADGETLNVSVSPYFSSTWLTPRLPSFFRLHPRINLRLHHSYHPPDYRREAFDLGINWGDGKWPNIVAEHVLTGAFVPLLSPRLVRRRETLRPASLLRFTLLFEFELDHWRDWFRQQGVAMPSSVKSLRIDDSHALRQAVLDGQGVALFFWGLARRDVATGKLLQPFPHRLEHGADYYLNYPHHAARRTKVTLFRRWIASEIRKNPFV
jgi:LysR family glycine cleavage system transcriptional activator